MNEDGILKTKNCYVENVQHNLHYLLTNALVLNIVWTQEYRYRNATGRFEQIYTIYSTILE